MSPLVSTPSFSLGEISPYARAESARQRDERPASLRNCAMSSESDSASAGKAAAHAGTA